MKILFIGCVKSSQIFLKSLIVTERNIIGVITKKESTFNSDFCDLASACEQKSIEYKYVTNINKQENVDFIEQKTPDIIYCFGWSQLLSEEIIRIPTMGVVGFHPAMLPQNRGRNPIIWALALGLQETASTFFMITPQADAGDIISQEVVKIEIEDDAYALYNKIMEIAIRQMEEVTSQFIDNTICYRKQDISASTSWRKRNMKDGEIDWRMSALSIYNLVRALSKPYVGAHFYFQDKLYKVWKTELLNSIVPPNIESGKILEVDVDGSFIVKTGDGAIRIRDSELSTPTQGEYLI